MFVVGIGGTTRTDSSTECALSVALDAALKAGARTRHFGSSTLCALPHYGTPGCENVAEAQDWVNAIRQADALIIASPGYHGAVSGLVKNALDYVEMTAKDSRPYLEGRAVGLIATAFGWQAAVSTLSSLRTIAHALRGWPTPFGAAVKTGPGLFASGICHDAQVHEQISLVGRQVVQFATGMRPPESPASTRTEPREAALVI